MESGWKLVEFNGDLLRKESEFNELEMSEGKN